MYSVVLDVFAVEAALVPEVLLELLVDVVGHRLPATTETHKDVQTLGRRRPHMAACDSLTAAQLIFQLSFSRRGNSFLKDV